jgi:phosphoglycolate phosphatase
MKGHLPACILFDLDGTLVDSLPGIEFSVREAFRACQLPVPEEGLREMIGPPIRTILFRAGNVAEESRLDALERAFRASYDSEGWQMAVCFPGANDVLRTMHERGHRLFVVSNKPRHISLQILNRERVFDYFEATVTRDSRWPHYRGKTEMIAYLLAERGIARENCLMVGDTIEDANAAATCGLRFAWMTYGYGTTVQMTAMPVAYKLDSLSQFLPLMTEELVRD